MRTVSVPDSVESDVRNVRLYLRTEANDEEYESAKYVSDMDETELAKAAKLLECSPDLLEEFNSHFDSLREAIHGELADLYQRQQQTS